MTAEIIVEFPSPLTEKEQRMIYGYKGELIRCRDCRHYYVINEVRGNCSEYNFVEKIPIDYCSMAERKEE